MKKSVILIITLILTLVLLSIGVGYFSYVANEKNISARSAGIVKAFYIAEAGLEKGLWRLRSGLTGSVTENFAQGSYTVSVSDLGNMLYRLDAAGQAQDAAGNILAARSLSLYVKETPFNVYSYFTDNEYFTQCSWGWCWQTPVWFVTGDRLEGPVFTNSEFHIAGDPAFYGPVKSASDQIIYMNGGPPNDNPYFDPAWSPNPALNQTPVNMPSFGDSNLQDLKDSAVQFEGDTYISFLDDGTMNVTNAACGWTNYNSPLPSEKSIIVNGGNLYVSGTLSGEITLAADVDVSDNKGNIVITDNLRFEGRYDEGTLRTDPLLPEDNEDYLGLIAAKDVIVSKDAPYNVEINASIMALGDSFIVERWWDAGYNKGELMILGGIIQEERGPVGTFSGETKQSGYSKNYIYDERLYSKNLPYFPTTGEYKVSSWEKN